MRKNMNNQGKMCSLCKKKEAVCKGMCWNCYLKTYRKSKRLPKRDIRHDRTKKIIIDYALNDISQSEIARKYGVSRQRVSTILKDANLHKGIDK